MSKNKNKGFRAEFKKFIARGNVIDLAVGVIIGGAFQAIVKSLVDNIVMPVIGIITKGVNLSNWFVALDGQKYATVDAAEQAGAAIINFGAFLSAVINFFIMAFIVFLIVRSINRVNEKFSKKEEPAPTTKKCPYCKSEINIEATRCPNCTSEIEEE